MVVNTANGATHSLIPIYKQNGLKVKNFIDL